MKIAIVLLMLLAGTSFGKMDKQTAMVGPPVLVYKTKKDYSKNVPVILSADKSKIISYPDPSDVKNSNGYPVPTKLKHGYLLDNRGIGANVAYLKMTYKQFASLHHAPSVDSMYSMIIDKDPLTKLCNCGSRYAMKDPVKEVNALIRKGTLKTVCTVLK